MTTEPLTTTPVTEAADSAETGLLVAVLLMVLFGAAAMLFMV
jgi:hypothetical protein